MLAPRETVDLLVTAVDSVGLSLEENNKALRMVDSARGREVAAPGGDVTKAVFVLRLVRLQDIGAEEAAATVGKLRSEDGEALAVASIRTLLLVDKRAQLERMEAVAHARYRPAIPGHVFVLPAHRQRPSDLVDAVEKSALGTLPGFDEPEPDRPSLIAVDAARMILLVGGELAYTARRGAARAHRSADAPGRGTRRRHRGLLPRARQRERSGRDIAGGADAISSQLGRSGHHRGHGRHHRGRDRGGGEAGCRRGEQRARGDRKRERSRLRPLGLPRRQVHVEVAVLDLTADLSRAASIASSQAGSPTSNSRSPGEIPVVGKLFQTKTRQRTKQDLLIVLTPCVVRDRSDLRCIHDRKEAELHERPTMFGDPAAYDPHVDHARKRGLLEEINRAGRVAEDDAWRARSSVAACG